jgi:hypothetical protein
VPLLCLDEATQGNKKCDSKNSNTICPNFAVAFLLSQVLLEKTPTTAGKDFCLNLTPTTAQFCCRIFAFASVVGENSNNGRLRLLPKFNTNKG